MAGRKRFDVQTPRASAWFRAAGVGALIVCVLGWAALPVSLAARGRKAPNTNRNAMTVGCAEASCCTSRCYLDENGVHHCVPIEGESCECGLSSKSKSSTSAFSQDLQIPPGDREDFSCTLPLAGFLRPAKTTLNRADLSVPTPPPR
jgi:hypothetical protein